MTLRRKLSAEEQEQIEVYEQQEETGRRLREQVKRFKTTFSLDALQAQLPLRFPCGLSGAESLCFRALSWYTYPGWLL